MVPQAGSPGSRCQHGQVLAKALFLPWWQPPSHCALAWQRWLWCLFLFLSGYQCPWIGTAPSGPHLASVMSLKALSPHTVTYEFGEDTIQSIAAACLSYNPEIPWPVFPGWRPRRQTQGQGAQSQGILLKARAFKSEKPEVQCWLCSKAVRSLSWEMWASDVITYGKRLSVLIAPVGF